MKATKPHILLVSTEKKTEGGLLHCVCQAISPFATCITWDSIQEFLDAGSGKKVHGIKRLVEELDLALFIFTAADFLNDDDSPTILRDAMFYELGLCVATLGEKRVMIAVQDYDGTSKQRLSLLNGMDCWRFNFNKKRHRFDRIEGVEKLIDLLIKERVEKEGFRQIQLLLGHKWGVDQVSKTFWVALSCAAITRHRDTIGNWQIVIAARLSSESTIIEQDANIFYTKPIRLPEKVDRNVKIEIPLHEIISDRELKEGDEFQARVLLVPAGAEGPTSISIEEARTFRCRDVDGMSYTMGKPRPAQTKSGQRKNNRQNRRA